MTSTGNFSSLFLFILQRIISNADHGLLLKNLCPLALLVSLVANFSFPFLLSPLNPLLFNVNVSHVLALGSMFFSFHTFSLCNSSTLKISIIGYNQRILKQSPDYNPRHKESLVFLTWSCMIWFRPKSPTSSLATLPLGLQACWVSFRSLNIHFLSGFLPFEHTVTWNTC